MTWAPAALLVVAALSVCACDDGNDGLPVPDLAVRVGPAREADEALRRAQRLLDADAPADAEPLLRRALELDPGHPKARRLLARVLVSQRRWAEATPLLRELLLERPGDSSLHADVSECLHVTGDLAAAEAAYRAWLELDASNDDAQFGLGQVLYDLGRYDEAVRAFKRAEKRRAGRADVRSELGLALQALGKLDEAETKQRDALERDPRSAEAWFRLGDVLSRGGPARLAEALDAMHQAVRLSPRHIHAQLYLYRLLRLGVLGGDESLAAESDRRWRTVLRLHAPQQVGRRAGTPRVDDVTPARERRLRDRLRAAPDDLVALRQLAELLHADGALDDALARYDELLAAGESDPALLAAAGAASLATERVSRAVELLTRAVQSVQSVPSVQSVQSGDAVVRVRRQLAWALLSADRTDEALAVYDALLADEPDDRLARLGHGLAQMRTDRLDEGLAAIAAAGWLR